MRFERSDPSVISTISAGFSTAGARWTGHKRKNLHHRGSAPETGVEQMKSQLGFVRAMNVPAAASGRVLPGGRRQGHHGAPSFLRLRLTTPRQPAKRPRASAETPIGTRERRERRQKILTTAQLP